MAENGLKNILNIDTVLPSVTNPYSESKQKLREHLNALPLKTIHLALERFYGPGIPSILNMVKTELLSDSLEVPFSHGTQLRDFIHVDDVIQGMDIVLSHWSQLQPYETIALGSGKSHSLSEVAEAIKKNLKSDKPFHYGLVKTKPGEDAPSIAHIEKLKTLGFQPRHSLFQDIATGSY